MSFYRNDDGTITAEVEASVVPDPTGGLIVVLRSYGSVEREGHAISESDALDMLSEWFSTMEVEDLPTDARDA